MEVNHITFNSAVKVSYGGNEVASLEPVLILEVVTDHLESDFTAQDCSYQPLKTLPLNDKKSLLSLQADADRSTLK